MFGFGRPNIEKLKARRDINGLIRALADYHEDEKAAEALVSIGLPAIPFLVTALMQKNDRIRAGSSTALVSIAKTAVAPVYTQAYTTILGSVKDSDATVRRNATYLLRFFGANCLGDNNAIPPLVICLGDKEAAVRDNAAKGLGILLARKCDPALRDSAITELVKCLKDSDYAVLESVIESLVEIGEPAVGSLIKALNDSDECIRSEAATVLGEIGDPEAIEPLIAALNSSLSFEAHRSLVKIGQPAVGPLIKALKDPHWDIRYEAAEALGKIGDPIALEPLIAALTDSYRMVRAYAAKALGEIGDPRAIEPLIKILNDDGVCNDAVWALGEIGDPRAIEPLLRILPHYKPIDISESDYNKRISIVREAVIKIGKPAIEPLVIMLNDYDGNQYFAADALKNIGWIPGKDEAAANYWIMHNNFEKCMDIGELSVEPLIKALNNSKWDVRRGAALTLDKMNWIPGKDEAGASYFIVKCELNSCQLDRCLEIGSLAIKPLINGLTRLPNHRDRVKAANFLITLYKSGTIDENSKKAILTARGIITEPCVDKYDSHCNTHIDNGIGIDFPI